MQTTKWGSSAWDFYHTLTFNYPENPNYTDKQNMKDTFELLKKMLPCSLCRVSFTFFCDHIPIDNYLDDRNGIVYWLYILHNLVNLKLNNKLYHLKDVILKYENNRARENKCREKIEWNSSMELIYRDSIEKYQNDTIRMIATMICENRHIDDIKNIILNIERHISGDNLF
jgi:hypothetical protein